jgi:lysophospholipase L1-like esterase
VAGIIRVSASGWPGIVPAWQGVDDLVTSPGDTFTYSNRSDRPRGRWVGLAGRVLPGVGRVQAQVAPYAAAWRSANVEALAQDGPLWVVLGDSLSQGIGAPAFDLGWVGQLHARLALAGREYRIVNLSVSGAHTADLLDRQLPALDALPNPPDLVTVMVGSNDLMRRSLRRDLPARFRTLLEAVPVGTAVSTLPNPTPTATATNAVITSVARERGLVVAEMRAGRTASWRGKLAADHFHPNEFGYAALADVFATALLR